MRARATLVAIVIATLVRTAAADPTTVQPAAPKVDSTGPQLLGGLGAMGLLAGAVLAVKWVLSSTDASQAHGRACPNGPASCVPGAEYDEYREKAADARVAGPATVIAAGLGAAAIAGALVWRNEQKTAAIAPIAGPSVAGASLVVTW